MINKLAAVFLVGLTASGLAVGAAAAQETVIVGHFGNPTPDQVAAADAKFEKATGWKIDWRKFAAGTDVIAAMASGDVNVAELGSSPMAIAATQGLDLQMFMVAEVIGTAESLIVRNGSGIETLADLKGKRIGVPIGSTSHFSLMGALKHAGVDPSDVTIMNMSPDQLVAAWQQGAIDAGFVWEPAQGKLMEDGTRLVGADKTAEWGYPTFDAWVVNKDFAESHKEAMIAFTKTMAEANGDYLADPSKWTADSEPVKTIAERTGAAPDQVPAVLAGYTFLPLKEQIDSGWLGEKGAAAVKSTAEFLQSAGRIDGAADDYSASVTEEYAKAAASE
ncbi:taurine ABC transporter substrate-binding protein [Jiella endophytica]|uniref:Taurine ABC transporter substrate-binding protein n=1 Tax=Jiella endophytica TaxID=2558362 RepID=A0A4Y8RAF5_9HYPH|nr:taurine ABC transporter substrate-binding protein [Jiella endophytica]TFF17849.1 taurine ABC transporter substrate-binding protein [Jiella endophytica]